MRDVRLFHKKWSVMSTTIEILDSRAWAMLEAIEKMAFIQVERPVSKTENGPGRKPPSDLHRTELMAAYSDEPLENLSWFKVLPKAEAEASKQRILAIRSKMSDSKPRKWAGSISKKTARELLLHVQQSRDEWEQRI